MIIKLDPTTYRKHIYYNKHGKPRLYIQLKKALYGTLKAALIFWKLLSEILQEWGFTLNPLICCKSRHGKSHRDIHDTWKRSFLQTKLNTKSSTEAKLVAVDNAVGQLLWTRHFLAAQGHPVPTMIIYQDKGKYYTAENSRTSSLKNTSYQQMILLCSGQNKKSEVKVTYFPTTNMLGDLCMKP